MGDEAASFDGKGKTFWRPFIPPLKDLPLRQAIEGDIELDGVKILSIEFEPFPLGQVRWIEDPIPPVGIVITACPDENHNYKGFEGSRIRGFKCFIFKFFARSLDPLNPCIASICLMIIVPIA